MNQRASNDNNETIDSTVMHARKMSGQVLSAYGATYSTYAFPVLGALMIMAGNNDDTALRSVGTVFAIGGMLEVLENTVRAYCLASIDYQQNSRFTALDKEKQ